jgi:hypothetical protein
MQNVLACACRLISNVAVRRAEGVDILEMEVRAQTAKRCSLTLINPSAQIELDANKEVTQTPV